MTQFKRRDAYGEAAAAILAEFASYLDAAVGRFITSFYDNLATQLGPSAILGHLGAVTK